MFFSVRKKAMIVFIGAALIGFAVLFVFDLLAENRLVAEQAGFLQEEAIRIAESDKLYQSPELSLTAHALNADIWIIDTEGTVLASGGSETAPESLRDHDLSAYETSYGQGTFFDLYSEDVITVSAPISGDMKTEGRVFLHYPVSRVHNSAREMKLIANIVYGVMVFLLVIVYLLLNTLIFRPLKKVTRAGREYANGNLTFPLDVKRRDEIGRLAEAEKKLAKEVRNASDDQRKFLANVSHDFRSPLTSIRGYAVAIQDGTIPPELQGKYLGVVVSEAERLTGLANSLLELNQLEKGIVPDKAFFDINELIRSLLPSFEGRAREKRIVFDFIVETKELSVNADSDRIRHVMQNLIDNALKFSYPDSSIEISTRTVGGKAFISVRDYGMGIENENLSKIWNRFYKTDDSRGKDKTGTGLGLSIVREIIQAHEESIDVISSPEKGTEFIFTLSLE